MLLSTLFASALSGAAELVGHMDEHSKQLHANLQSNQWREAGISPAWQQINCSMVVKSIQGQMALCQADNRQQIWIQQPPGIGVLKQ